MIYLDYFKKFCIYGFVHLLSWANRIGGPRPLATALLEIVILAIVVTIVITVIIEISIILACAVVCWT